MNYFKIKDACIEIMTNNASLQDNNVKMKFDLKVENSFCEISDKVPRFFLVWSEAYSKTYWTPDLKSFAKIVNDWIKPNILTKAPCQMFGWVLNTSLNIQILLLLLLIEASNIDL